MVMNFRDRYAYLEGSRRQGKSSIASDWLRFRILQVIKCNVPSVNFVLWKDNEIITWLPTGEVISRRF